MVERELPKLYTRVRFPSPAPNILISTSSQVYSNPGNTASNKDFHYPDVYSHLLKSSYIWGYQTLYPQKYPQHGGTLMPGYPQMTLTNLSHRFARVAQKTSAIVGSWHFKFVVTYGLHCFAKDTTAFNIPVVYEDGREMLTICMERYEASKQIRKILTNLPSMELFHQMEINSSRWI